MNPMFSLIAPMLFLWIWMPWLPLPPAAKKEPA